MKKFKKMKCYVVYAYYNYELYENNESPLCEEIICKSYSKAEEIKEMYQKDDDFHDVYIELEERELLIDNENIPDSFTDKEIY